MIPEIRNNSYHQRIQELDLISLVQWRLRGQLIEVFLNTWIDSLLPVQEGSSIMTLMTEQETMEQNLLYNISIHQLHNTFTQLK